MQSNGDELSTVPGFGWASTASLGSNKVVLDPAGFEFSTDEALNKSLLSVLLKSETGPEVYDACMAKLRGGVTAEEFDEVLRTGLSCGRRLKVDIMTLAPNISFSLHSHPQVEVISILTGEIFEYRLEDGAAVGSTGEDLRASAERAAAVDLSCRASSFRLQSAAAGGYIVNRPGSVHLSFTRAEPTVLLVFWSGVHWKMNVAVEFAMPPEVLPL